MEHYIGRVCCCRSPSCSLYFWLMLQRKSPTAAAALKEEDGRQGCVHSTQNKLVSPSSPRTCSTFIMVGTAVLFFFLFYAARLSVCWSSCAVVLSCHNSNWFGWTKGPALLIRLLVDCSHPTPSTDTSVFCPSKEWQSTSSSNQQSENGLDAHHLE